MSSPFFEVFPSADFFKLSIKDGITGFDMGSKPEKADAQGQDTEDTPSDKTQLKKKIIVLVALHHL